jgi:predicted nucleotidyltransferase
MINLLELKRDIEVICKELSLRRLDLVGSTARGDFDEESDVDVLVTFAGDEYLFDRYFDLKQRLEKLFNRKVDVIEERALKNPYFKQSVERDRVKIYGA